MRARTFLLLSALLLALPAAAQQAPANQPAHPPPVRQAPSQPARQPTAHQKQQQKQQPPQQSRRPAQPQQPQRPQPPQAPPPVPAVSPPPAAAPPTATPAVGTETKLPIPRFAALDHNMVNMRVGPGTNYPADWTYRRRDLPVEIVSEFQNWRQIRDQDGTTGWVRSSALSGRRTFIVKGNEVTLRRRPDADAPPVAKLMPGVVGRIRSCAEGSAWCEVQTGDYRGYLPRSSVWGVSANEAIGG
jgi:SH3-like domain-containing protein